METASFLVISWFSSVRAGSSGWLQCFAEGSVSSLAFRLGHPVRVDAGGWGQLELRHVDLTVEVAAEMEHHEARERFLAEVPDDEKRHFEWVDVGDRP